MSNEEIREEIVKKSVFSARIRWMMEKLNERDMEVIVDLIQSFTRES